MKIAVLGSGAMGSLYGTYLSQSEEVTMVDVLPDLVDHINRQGIRGMEPDGQVKQYSVRAVQSGEDIGIQDIVLVFVKGMYTKTVIQQNLSMIGEHTWVVTLQNGAGNNRDIAAFVPRERIFVGTSSHNCVVKGMGVYSHSGNGPTNIGPDMINANTVENARKIAEVFSRCGFETHVIPNIQEVLWEKIFVNCGINALSMIMRQPIGAVRTNPFLWNICKRITYECVMVAEADGTYFDRAEALKSVEQVCVNNSDGLASMYQDSMNGRLTEIDRINGIIVELGAEYRIDVPYNRMLVEMVHGAETASGIRKFDSCY